MGATSLSTMTLSITKFSIMTLKIKGLYVTLSINGNQHMTHTINDTQPNWPLSIRMLCNMMSVVKLNATFYLLLC